jgi:mitochondrial fission protein ELM1
MVGGNSKKQKPNNSEYFELGTKVIHGVKNLDAQLIVSFSRRTPSKAIKILQSTFSKHLNDFKILSSDENNLYPKILKIIDYTIVTSDSVNMISELATLSKPLFIFHFSKESRKISFFISNLRELNIVQDYEGYLFKFEKNKLQTNRITILQVNKFFGFK